jgi:hypothetical protein
MIQGTQGKKPNPVAWLITQLKITQLKERTLKNLPNADLVANRLATVKDDFLTEFFKPYSDHKTKTFYIDHLVQALLEVLNFPRPNYAVGGIRVRIESLTTAFPPGLEVDIPTAGRASINTKWMEIKAKLAVRCTAAEVGEWEIGFIQTVERLERKFTWRKKNGDQKCLRTWIDGPHKDGPKGYLDAWFDPQCKTDLDRPFKDVDVMIKDRPGFSWTVTPGVTLEELRGGEAFKTWLALRKKNRSETRFLHVWPWHTDYTIVPQNLPRFGIDFGRDHEDTTGIGAVLTGPSGKDAFKHEERDIHNMAVSFDELRNMRIEHNI